MHQNYFPKCEVDGPLEPRVPYSYGWTGFIPKKCDGCSYFFEGGCRRATSETNRYHVLDYGPCEINGPTDPVEYEDAFVTAKVEVPRKCANCSFLRHDRIHGFICKNDGDKWGDHRGLDWGNWEPDSVYFDLPFPKVTTKKMNECVKSNDLVGFISEYRDVNPNKSIKEARGDFQLMQDKLKVNSGKK